MEEENKMSASAAQAFFNPTSPFGELSGWSVQNENPTTASTRAQALGSDGLEVASRLHDKKTSVSATYVATSEDAAIPRIGQVLNGYHIDDVNVAYSNTAFAQMTLSGHKHVDTDNDTHGATGKVPRQFAGSLTTVGTLFGCPSAPLGMSIPTGAGVRSMTYHLSVNHVDELGSEGKWLNGDNYDPTETVEVELCDSGVITAANGWDLTSAGNSLGNTAAETATATVEKHLTTVSNAA